MKKNIKTISKQQVLDAELHPAHGKKIADSLLEISDNFEKHLREKLGISGLKLTSFTVEPKPTPNVTPQALSGCVYVGNRLICGKSAQ